MSTATKVGLGLGAAAVAALGTRSYLKNRALQKAVQEQKSAHLRAEGPTIRKLISDIDAYTNKFNETEKVKYAEFLQNLAYLRGEILSSVSRLEALIVNHQYTDAEENVLRARVESCRFTLENFEHSLKETSATLRSNTLSVLAALGSAAAIVAATYLNVKKYNAEFNACSVLQCTKMNDEAEKAACESKCYYNVHYDPDRYRPITNVIAKDRT
jgi:hypothetical protein